MHPGLRDFFYITKEEAHELADIIRARKDARKKKAEEKSPDTGPESAP